MSPSTFRTTVASLLVAVTVAPVAFAGGNSQPQRRSTDQISPQRVIQGDGQNLLPRAAQLSNLSRASVPAVSPTTASAEEAAMRAAAGKAKSQQPLTSSVLLVRTSSGFQWGDAGIGAAAATGQRHADKTKGGTTCFLISLR